MKTKILFFFLILLFPFFCFAESSITLSMSSSQVELWEDVMLDVIITSTGSQIGDITIPGIEDFDIFSTSQSQRFQNINGEMQNEFLIQLQLTAKNLWEFQLWPVETQVWDETISSNTLTIQVWEQILSPSLPSVQTTPSSPQENVQDATGETLEFRDELRAPEKTFSMFAKIFFFLLWLWVFVFLFFWVLRKYFSSENTQEESEMSLQKTDFRTLIEKYFSETRDAETHTFFRGLNLILRAYLEEHFIPWAKEKTLQELQKTEKIPKEFLKVFEESYIGEYNDREETPIQRGKLKDKILKHIY